MKIAITGVTGHIGGNLLPILLAEGHEVVAIYRSDNKIAKFQNLVFEKIKGDILDAAFLEKAFKGVEVVIHLAAKISINGDMDGSVMKTNVDGVKNVINSCIKNKVKKLIHFSSIHAMKYDSNSELVNESSPFADIHSFKYDQSKALGEMEVFRAINNGLDAVILNPTGVVGPNDLFGSLSGQMLSDMLNGKLPVLIHGGFDWVDVRDVVQAVVSIINKGNKSNKYILSGEWASFKKLSIICQNVSNRKRIHVAVPVWMAMIGLPFIKIGEWVFNSTPLYTYESLMIVKHGNRNISSKLAKEEIGFSNRSIEDTIKSVFEEINKN